jgi:hypothetical protein
MLLKLAVMTEILGGIGTFHLYQLPGEVVKKKIRRCRLQRLRASLPQLEVTANLAVQFSIITPSFRNSKWLKLCIASVADQEGVQFEHIVQDAGSDDGTRRWTSP